MHARVVTLYGFHPAQVSDADRTAKSKEMDIFWNEMKATPDLTLPLLRTELRERSDPPFFLYDGSQLLLALSKTKDDEEIVATKTSRPMSLMAPGEGELFGTGLDAVCAKPHPWMLPSAGTSRTFMVQKVHHIFEVISWGQWYTASPTSKSPMSSI